ncbi:MAG TPA: ABC transporter substrate binding protein, partial [candidate division Zixibacteria bacterium]|nr:ABC transporter substrate binding protein [candidate division Zixibacteria bacterium]
ELQNRVDALYLTPLFGLNLEQISGFLQQAQVQGLPVFSSEGYYQVERGAFASNSGYTTTGAALYHARKTIKILQGARPQELPTVFREGRRLSINLQACRDHHIVTPEHFLADARVLEPPVDPGAPVYTIASALAEAKRLNPGALADQESASAARSRVAEVRAAYYPQLNAGAYLRGYDRDPPVNALRRYTEGSSGFDVTLTQKIFDYPLLKRMTAAASQADLAESEWQSSRIEFDYTVSELYLTLVLALSRRDALDEYRERIHRGLQGALALYQMEDLERVELLRWESKKEEASEALIAARGEISELEVEFLAALGRPFREEFTVDRGLYALTEFKWAGPENPVLGGVGARGAAEEFWVAEALRVRPESAGIAASLTAKEAELSAARAWYWPSLSAEAGYFKDNQFETGAPLTVDEDGWFVGARLSAALFDGAQSLKRSARLRTEVSELEYRRDQNSLAIAAVARRAFTRLASSYDRTLFAWRSQKMAADALEALFGEYERSRLNYSEVSEALDRALESELDALGASYGYFLALMDLWRVTGYGYVEENSALQRDLYDRLRAFVAAQR